MTMITQAGLLEELALEERELGALLERVADERWAGLRRADGWSVAEIAGHIGDSCYGLALMAAGKLPLENVPSHSGGQLDIGAFNEERRQRHAAMSRAKLMQRVGGGFAEARRVIAEAPDDALSGPVPFAPTPTLGEWFGRIIAHAASHRAEIAELVGQ